MILKNKNGAKAFVVFVLILFLKLNLQSQSMHLPPPGTKMISKTWFMDKEPISYESYYEFLYYLNANDQTELYSLMLPADSLIKQKGEYLWRNPATGQLPISGLSIAQMKHYCQWRSEVVNLLKFNPDRRQCNSEYWNKMDKADQNGHFKVLYRIPYEYELSKKERKQSKKYSLAEFSIPSRDTIDLVNDVNAPKNACFRCIATYEPIPGQ